MDIESWSAAILKTVQEFDRSTAPYGLYSVRDLTIDPHRARILDQFTNPIRRSVYDAPIAPFSGELGRATAWAKRDEVDWNWNSRDGAEVELRLIRLAKFKVRKFGSSYHVDKHETFEERWSECNLGASINRLWSDPRQTATRRAALFIGFDKALRPFERELGGLKPHLAHASHGAVFSSRDWQDVHG